MCTRTYHVPTYLEAEVHDGEGEVVALRGPMVGEEVEIVIKLQQCEVDEAQQVGPNVHCLVGQNKRTATRNTIEMRCFRKSFRTLQHSLPLSISQKQVFRYIWVQGLI